MRRQFVAAAGAAVLALAMAGCKQEAKAPEPVRPVLSTVLRPAASGSAVAVGTVQPRYETNLGFRVLGRLIARPVNVGDLVAEGQIIAAIEEQLRGQADQETLNRKRLRPNQLAEYK